MEVTVVPFGQVNGKTADLITITNKNGLQVSLTNYGCIVTSLIVPDRNGNKEDVVLGYESLEKYLAGHPFFGAIAGRCANRIQDGKFTLDGVAYLLETNEPPTVQHLHGGSKGFDKYVWGYDIEEKADVVRVHLHRVSPDGESGYPGTLSVTHTIALDDTNQLHFNFCAHTSKPTILNLVNHSYYNLAGHDKGSVENHELKLFADHYTPVAENMIPTGEVKSVAGSGLDFREGAVIGQNMDKLDGRWIDHNFVLNGEGRGKYKKAAELYDPASGRVMEVETTQPAIQFYNGFKLSNKPWFGRNGYKYEAFGGLCLETQHFPDSPNKPHFPSIRLDPEDVYKQKTIHRFSTR
ncbi:aldose epimerase family protein [Pseudovibrio sp. JE062]|uniref:aldose epimerase family protein n=1 Tax=Pseudovibrio sp. JE062 TaxID=439495 RepID=UPI000186BD63|nr:aldose epimerase family protein [Pseudovibrio sp. JE062]EEA96703.1 aldose 1-epimerase [Pseudovibrio sp. JE062]